MAYSCTTSCDSAVFCALPDLLACLDRHTQLTRCFSAVAELLLGICNKYEISIDFKIISPAYSAVNLQWTDIFRSQHTFQIFASLNASWQYLMKYANSRSYCTQYGRLLACRLSVCDEECCGAQGRCSGLKVVPSLGVHFLFTSSDTFTARCIVQPLHTVKNRPPKFPRLE